MVMLYLKKCACGEKIFGAREGNQARGAWLGHNKCPNCREADASPAYAEVKRHFGG